MLPLAGEAFAYNEEALSLAHRHRADHGASGHRAIMAPWAGRRANTWGRRPLLLVGFTALPIRALVFA